MKQIKQFRYYGATSEHNYPTTFSNYYGTLIKGNIFEGTVNSVKGGQVVLGLSNGNLLTAKLDESIQLTQGQSMFFEVKS